MHFPSKKRLALSQKSKNLPTLPQGKKDASSRKKSRSSNIKEIRFTPFIADGDYQNRIKKAREFLEEGNKVKLNVKFVGRQITKKDFGDTIMNRAIDDLSDLATVEREPALVGKILSSQLQPKKGTGNWHYW